MKKIKSILLICCMLAILFLSCQSVMAETTPTIYYQAHVQDIGWQNWVSNGSVAGTTGQAKQIEAIRISSDRGNLNVNYRVHVQDIGWQKWVSNGSVAGTIGQAKQIEAIQIYLSKIY
jgi:uncharacterized protein YjdB